jgi:hypothetical protein
MRKRPSIFTENFFTAFQRNAKTRKLAGIVKQEIQDIKASISKFSTENGHDEQELLDWPMKPYILRTEDGSDVITLDGKGYKKMLLFITEEEANEFAALFKEHTGQDAKVIPSDKLYPFKTECLLTLKGAGFEMWYGTYVSNTVLLEHEAMKATGLI